MGGGTFSPAWRRPMVETDVEAVRCSSRCSGSYMGTRDASGCGGRSRRSFDVPVHGDSSSMADGGVERWWPDHWKGSRRCQRGAP
jgi:hypothetical protein